METTKNTQYIKVPQALLDQMCGEHLKEKIRQRCKQMEAQVNACETVWLKLRERDFYIQTKEKVLFPDTTKMRETWFAGYTSGSSYAEMVAVIQRAEYCRSLFAVRYADFVQMECHQNWRKSFLTTVFRFGIKKGI